MDAITDFFRTRLGIAVAALVALAVVGAGAFFFLSGSSATDAAPSASKAPEGMITVQEAPPLPALDQAQPAVEAPSTPVAQVFLPEKCAAAAGPVRDVMKAYPSGLALDEAGSDKLNSGLSAMSTDCTPEEVAAFQAQELIPWTTYAVPAK